MNKDLQNNPYRQQTPVISKFQSWLDEHLGTNYQARANYQNDLLAAQWDSENNLRLQDREYNSPANQAELMREAGINPDLSGGVSPFESQTAGNSMNSGLLPNMPETIAEPVIRVGQGIINGIQLALGLRSGILNLKSLSLDVDKKAFTTADEVVKSLFGMQENGMEGNFDIKPLISSIKNRTLKRQLKEWYSSYKDEAFDSSWYRFKHKSESARQEYLSDISNPLYNSDDTRMVSTLRDYNRMFLDIERLNSAFQKKYMSSQSKQMDVQDMMNDYYMASKPWETNVGYQKAQQELQMKIQTKLQDFFDKQMEKDNLWSQILLMSIFSSQTGAFNPLDAVGSAVSGIIPGISTLTRTFNPVKNK